MSTKPIVSWSGGGDQRDGQQEACVTSSTIVKKAWSNATLNTKLSTTSHNTTLRDMLEVLLGRLQQTGLPFRSLENRL